VAASTTTLPAAPQVDQWVWIKDVGGNCAALNQTINRNGNTIDGLPESLILDIDFGDVMLMWNGTTWAINPDAIGTTGPQGNDGAQGPQGIPGVEGPEGPPGSADIVLTSLPEVGEYAGQLVQIRAQETLALYDVVTFDLDATYGMGARKSVSTSILPVMGVVVIGGAADEIVTVLVSGYVRTTVLLAPGALVYNSAIAGGMTSIVPETTGEKAKIIGVSGSSRIVWVSPQLNMVGIK